MATSSTSSTRPNLLPKMTPASADNKAMEEVMAEQVADASSTNPIVALDGSSSSHQKDNINTLNLDDPKTPVHARPANYVPPQEKEIKKIHQYQKDKVSTLTSTSVENKRAKQFQFFQILVADFCVWSNERDWMIRESVPLIYSECSQTMDGGFSPMDNQAITQYYYYYYYYYYYWA